VREGRKLGDLAQSLLRLGNLRRAQGRTGEAGDLHKQAHRRFLDLGSLPGQFESLIEQAVDAAATGSHARVIELLSRAEALMPAIDDRRLIGRFHRLRALTLRRQGDLAGASETLGLALENFRASADPVGEIEALYQTALLREQQGRSRAAMDLLDHAIDNIEQSRLGVSNHALRASFTGERMDVFGKKVELLISAGDAERALEVAMNSRTRVLVESMLYKAAPGEDTERVHAQELKARLSAKSEARRRLQQMWPDSEEIRAIDQDIADVLVELDALEASLLSGRIGSTPEVTARQLRGLLTDEILIAHWVGETMSWRWEIRADHLAVTAMPPRRELHAEIERARSAIRASRRSKPHDSSRLASWLLGDIDLSAISHLYVIPDGATAIVPYNALTVPDDPGSLMIERTPITVVPGASLLGSRPRADSKKLAVLVSDPVFGADDPRVESTSAEAGFPRLAFSGHEASAVAESLRRRGYTVTDYRGFAANKEAVLSDELARASVVHFATHGLVDDDHPEASGLLLSSVTEAGEPRNGLLSLAEIYGLDLDAELIVLSACDTALGRDVIGEGPISLARGFLVGGSRQVVASLWQVSDVATKELMTRFYSAWADGRSAARALRDAQLELSRTRRFGGSHYWGAFVLVGAGETNDSLEAGSRRVSEPMNKAGGNHALQAHANRAPRVRTRLRMRRVSQGLAGGRGILRDYRTESHRPRR
jgi:CHAT domain-containing protein